MRIRLNDPDAARAELVELSESFGFDFTSLLTESKDGALYFHAIPGLWKRRFTLPTIGKSTADLDSPTGFRLFHLLVLGLVQPLHARGWIEQFYKDLEANKGTLVLASRALAKSTETTLFIAFRQGLAEGKIACLYVRGSDQAARQAGKEIVKIVSHNPGWKVFWPHIVPDTGDKHVTGRDQGSWSLSGYDVINTEIPPAEWAQITAARIGNSFMCSAYKGTAIRGKRADVIVLDDAQLTEVARSAAELQRLKEEFGQTIMQTARPNNPVWKIVLGTPSPVVGDLYDDLAENKRWTLIEEPATVGGQWPGEPIWPDWLSVEELTARFESAIRPEDFWLEYMLDKNRGKNVVYNYLTYPGNKIDPDKMYLWASMDPSMVASPDASHNAIMIGGLALDNPEIYVVIDGLLEKADMNQTIMRLQQFMSLYKLNYLALEVTGPGGKAWEQKLWYDLPGLTIVPIEVAGLRKKEDRDSLYLLPMLGDGTFRMSTTQNPYLERSHTALMRAPNFSRNSGDRDLVDSLTLAAYHMRHGADTSYLGPRKGGGPKSNPFRKFLK